MSNSDPSDGIEVTCLGRWSGKTLSGRAKATGPVSYYVITVAAIVVLAWIWRG